MEIARKSILPSNQAHINAFIDNRDNGPLILTHFSLLLGCATPIWMLHDTGDERAVLGRLAGICSIGMGDSFV